MRIKSLLFILLAIICLSPEVESQTREYLAHVGNFTKLKIKDGVPVDYIYSADSSGIVTFTANDAVSQAITFVNNKEELVIQLEPRDFGVAYVIPVVTVRSNHLDKVINEGDSATRVLTAEPTAVFEVKVTGNGSISVRDIEATKVTASLSKGTGTIAINGVCTKASLSNSCKGTIQAAGLIAEDVNCTITGTGNIDCYATRQLNIKGTGPGTLYYAGNPKDIKKHTVNTKVVDVSK